MNFTDEHKKESNFGQRFAFGVHKVSILGFNLCGTEEGEKEYVEVGFTDEEGRKEGNVRLYFNTEGNSPISFDILRTIFVHNAPEDKKEAAKASFNGVENSKKMVDLLNSKLIGKEMWYTKYYDAKGGTYQKEGQTYRSVRESVMGYPTNPKLDLMPKPKESVTQAAGEVFPNDEPFPSSPAKGADEESWT